MNQYDQEVTSKLTASRRQKRQTVTNATVTHSVGGDALEPVIVEVKQDHLRLSGLQNEVSQLLHLETGLEGQLQLTALDHNVGEIQQVNLENVYQAYIFYMKLSTR